MSRIAPAPPSDLPRDGVLPIDKPVGVTSHDVVAAVRHALGGVKTGHAGTLDPFASGLLLVLVGAATRIQRDLLELPKRYETVAALGAISSTGDPEGEITLTGRLPDERAELPTGELRQRPPIYSAIKIGGERAYRRARRGERFQMPERIVTVHRFEQLWREGQARPGGLARAAYAIECSSGTYVRSLIADLGDAYCVELRRTAIGPFTVEDALAPPLAETGTEGTYHPPSVETGTEGACHPAPVGEQWRPRLISVEAALAALPRPTSRAYAAAARARDARAGGTDSTANP